MEKSSRKNGKQGWREGTTSLWMGMLLSLRLVLDFLFFNMVR